MEINLNDVIPIKFQPLIYNEDRFLVMKGSAGSGKSVFASMKLVTRCLNESPHRHLVMRKVGKDLLESIFYEIDKVISDWGLKNRTYYRAQKSRGAEAIYLRDSKFIFTGLDDKERIKSISDITSITFEELTEFTEHDWDQANLRLRGKHLKEYKQAMAMFNPVDENHWVKKRFVDNPPKRTSLTFDESTYKDNPHLDDEYIDMLNDYEHTNSLYYQVYCLGDWGVVDTSNKFLYSFNQEKHVNPCELDENHAVKLSFDFNLEPFAVTVYQTPDKDTSNFIDKIRLNNSDIYQVCDVIKAKYPNHFYIVTGDASGKSRTGTVRGKDSYWRIIKRELQLKDAQIKLRNMNLGLIESRVLCNSALQHKNVNIDPSLIELINDCKYATVDDKGILVKDRNKNANDFLDTFRYALDIEWPKLIRNPKNVR